MIRTTQVFKNILQKQGRQIGHENLATLFPYYLGYGSQKLSAQNFYKNNHVQRIHTTSRVNEDGRKVKTKILTISNPFKFLSLKVKLFLMRSYFDPKFTEDDFLIGAKQAVLFISEKMASGNFQDLDDVMTAYGLQSAHQIYDTHQSDDSSLLVEESDIMKVALHDMSFEYGESGQKWAYALTMCYCSRENSFIEQESDFEIDILTSKPRIVKLSFRRDYTPGTNAGWLIDQLDFKDMLKF